MTTRDASCLADVRSEIEKATAILRSAAQTLRTAGWTETADHLIRDVKVMRIYTEKDGYLHWLERPEEPEPHAG